ncbi:hypothetical protein EWB00_007820 [Schistosoma japonicum]|uniref:Uncharacterized protein n=2 Tax=Schistosoma japonicum TaxID=6182 RepID=A0A4Z2CTD1_SCHJA|nr:hypothetical protein KSF78_0007767 [Schistosoma japonicum]KAH8862263.1 hypothetical protein KSF78_0007767 [Schistosoma japonicum]KAH8862264.1 hypothetical protein KSF78_0007767 [Schistosoma japonicum]TNN07270.1 hypothetical protein EWB00_007820 [Schistosoma japonicum]
MDPAFLTRLNDIAEKYNYEFHDCDVVDLTEFSITKPGDFLTSLPDNLYYGENDDVENIQPSLTKTGSFTDTIIGTCSDIEKEVKIEDSLVHENCKIDLRSVEAALSCKYCNIFYRYLVIIHTALEKSISSWEKRRFRSLDLSNSYTSNSSNSSSRNSRTQESRNHSRHTTPHMKSKTTHRLKRLLHNETWKSPVQLAISKQRVIEWLKHQESFMSQLIH